MALGGAEGLMGFDVCCFGIGSLGWAYGDIWWIILMKLNSGILMPQLAFGTYKVRGKDAGLAFSAAYKSGFRHFDTASLYENEEDIGDWIKVGGISRETLFITTKVWPTEYRHIHEACNTSLKKLQTNYIDLLLLHWPVALKQNFSSNSDSPHDHIDRYPLYLAWQQMESLLATGKVRSIGVSNWNVSLLNDLLSSSHVPPSCNQIEFHLYNQKKPLIAFCHSQNVVPVAYRVIFSPPMNEPKYKLRDSTTADDLVQSLSQKYSVSPQQLLIKWALQQNCGVITKSSNPSRIQANWDSQSFQISQDDMSLLNQVPHRGSYTNPESLLGLYIE